MSHQRDGVSLTHSLHTRQTSTRERSCVLSSGNQNVPTRLRICERTSNGIRLIGEVVIFLSVIFVGASPASISVGSRRCKSTASSSASLPSFLRLLIRGIAVLLQWCLESRVFRQHLPVASRRIGGHGGQFAKFRRWLVQAGCE